MCLHECLSRENNIKNNCYLSGCACFSACMKYLRALLTEYLHGVQVRYVGIPRHIERTGKKKRVQKISSVPF